MKRYLRHLPALLGVLLLVGAIYVVQREFRHLKLSDIKIALAAIPASALIISFGWTVLSYGVLTFYDRLGTIYAGHKVTYRRVAFASFCAYALSHNLGFAAVSGAAVRYRLYSHWGLTAVQIAKVVGFCSLTFGLGGLVLGGCILFFEPLSVPFFAKVLPLWAFYAIGTAMWAVVATYVVISKVAGTVRVRGHEFNLPNWRMAVVQVALASVDVAVTAAIFYALIPPTPGLTYLRFLACYLASYSAGLIANLPGGLGVFDTAMLLGLEPYLPPPVILGAILVFRLYYYIIPLFMAGTMFALNEILLRGGALVKGGKVGRSLQGLVRISEPDFAVGAATGAVAICGALLLSLGVLDDRPDFSWIDPDFADMAASAGQFVPSLIGAALMVLAIGLSQRVTLAWGGTIALLLVAAGYTAAQGNQLWISAVLALSAVLVAPFRDAFYRHARVLTSTLQAEVMVPLIALAVCVIALAAFEPQVRRLSENSWWEIVLSPDLPNSLRVVMALAVLMALLALWRLLRPGHVTWLPWAGEGRLRYASLGAQPPNQADGIVMGEAGRSGIPFLRMGRVMLGLGDPAGSPADRISAIWRLRDLAAQEGLDPAVWRAGPGLLKVYGDLGLTALPLGPDGQLLPENADSQPAALEYLCCVAERDLVTLEPQLHLLAERELDAAE
ncbi:lysylphosphatidylglycerol synthase domain-containing protein [Acidisphaera sp. L21]|uniref:lysylphosphatidylglycerol synthase domain-containing protein n=1 Tax=Acidisphaera sp. L21 TaxID=1641851 RepID=UPI00131EAA7E|nr:lysylphosphatidylglycerol synthase domain-containing protein [Acidisphaera sp. L21]